MNWKKVSMWAGILGVPPLALWYLSHFEAILRILPTDLQPWFPNLLLGIAVAFASLALLSLAVMQSKLAATIATKAPGQDSPSTFRPATELVPYREWAESWFREHCKNQYHNGSATLDLAGC